MLVSKNMINNKNKDVLIEKDNGNLLEINAAPNEIPSDYKCSFHLFQ